MAMMMRKSAVQARPVVASRPARTPAVVVKAASAAASEVPDMNKRNIMNLILLGGLRRPGRCSHLRFLINK
jgi:cytochrome b6-f complex iron-sulfur subunit